mmetsp:Transcript_35678/g.40538  ORF Transcript_35678/g.40538 Transcript_35678/m.40538 type:complete len:156 (+) Transcript_35678:1159-1626(+)
MTNPISKITEVDRYNEICDTSRDRLGVGDPTIKILQSEKKIIENTVVMIKMGKRSLALSRSVNQTDVTKKAKIWLMAANKVTFGKRSKNQSSSLPVPTTMARKNRYAKFNDPTHSPVPTTHVTDSVSTNAIKNSTVMAGITNKSLKLLPARRTNQ